MEQGYFHMNIYFWRERMPVPRNKREVRFGLLDEMPGDLGNLLTEIWVALVHGTDGSYEFVAYPIL